ncbi:hypothetical protein Pyn_33997 [Prunus yedoensis var. nudiflora]|uniref:Uncharacterized protein n=1 Tax=Prunus yedoensis var. nudiflora TaxID=2094558 RepID=A0A314UQU5_PRUYE|nr:hypothetical protein Pyn_33997 [Prunus yedoensis var. nudiflora]
MARHVWNIFSDSNTNLWTAWIKAHYLSEVSFWCVHPPSICSWNWRKMLNLRDILRSHFFMPLVMGSLLHCGLIIGTPMVLLLCVGAKESLLPLVSMLMLWLAILLVMLGGAGLLPVIRLFSKSSGILYVFIHVLLVRTLYGGCLTPRAFLFYLCLRYYLDPSPKCSLGFAGLA